MKKLISLLVIGLILAIPNLYAQKKNVLKYSLKLKAVPYAEVDLNKVYYVYPNANYKFQVEISPAQTGGNKGWFEIELRNGKDTQYNKDKINNLPENSPFYVKWDDTGRNDVFAEAEVVKATPKEQNKILW